MIRHLIENVLVESEDGASFDDVSPIDRRPWETVARGGGADAARAVAAARAAFDHGPWPHLSVDDRGQLLNRLADLIEENGEEIAQIETRDVGKPIAQARERDVPRSAHNFRFFADYARFVEDEAFPVSTPHHMYTRYEPVGVTAAISPWNFPLMLATWKVAPALAFGNTVVLKPAEQSPASCARLGELAVEAGIPPGVLNVVQGFGPGEIGEAMTRHPDVDLITFTGESDTARHIMRAAADGLAGTSFELGGKGANLVFADCDLERAVEWAIKAVFTNAGQICLAGSRIYVERRVYDEFEARFVAAAEAMVLGDPRDPATEIGPLISEEHWRKVASYIDLAVSEGAKVRTGGAEADWVVRPTVLTEVNPRMRVCREEIFGPVATLQPFDTEDEAVGLANDTKYGLNAMLFTENVRRAHRVAGRLRAGTVWVNCFFIRDLRAPFGGMGDSGIGREGGKHSRAFFTEQKAIVLEL